VTYNFQTGKNQINLLTEYKTVPEKVLLLRESILQTAKQLQHGAFLGKLPGFDQHLPAKCSVIPLLFSAVS
jgi:hypothetical protein